MDTVPTNYRLELEPDLEGAVFSGSEVISIRCKKPVTSLSIHAAELNITRAEIISGKDARAVSFRIDAAKERLHIRLGKRMHGTIKLRLEFSGILNDRLLGFYRSKYEEGGRTRYMATTQFEAADARRAFPCWDEPAAKATFDITLITKGNNTAISNMPQVSAIRKGEKTQRRFARTPVMSTYLVYFGVGQFKFLEKRSGRINIRVATVSQGASRGRYALDMASRLIAEYEKYFGIRYPLPKLDLIAVPDFAAGAMENWGAITFREALLLYDPKTSSSRTKQLIAEVVSHEIAHQWFGNLVTMEWWNDLWLNESFATFMATKFTSMAHPDWDLDDQFVNDSMNSAMSLDALASTHPIDVPVKEPAEIREIFDVISYDKGGCILRMLEDAVGEARFKRGLRAYLGEFKYNNARGDDLWRAIGKASGMPIEKMVHTWIGQSGFPLIEAHHSDGKIRMRQKRFTMGHKKGALQKWIIPLTSKSGNKTSKKLVTKKEDLIPAGSHPNILNYGRYGFYRIKYDEKWLLRLKFAIRDKSIPHIDRWAVQNDLYALCVAGIESVYSYLDFTDAYADETSYMVCADIGASLGALSRITHSMACHDMVSSYERRHFTSILDRLGWDAKKGERHTDALLRTSAIASLGRLGERTVADEAASRFEKASSLPGDLRGPVYTAVAWNGGVHVRSKLSSMYVKTDSQEEKTRILIALCSLKDKRHAQRTLDMALSDKVRSQNMHIPIVGTAANPYTNDILWPWIKQSWKGIESKVGAGNPLLSRIISSLAAAGAPESGVKSFFANPPRGTERAIAQTLERIRIRRAFISRIRDEMC